MQRRVNHKVHWWWYGWCWKLSDTLLYRRATRRWWNWSWNTASILWWVDQESPMRLRSTGWIFNDGFKVFMVMCGLVFIFDIYFIWKAFDQYKLNVKRFGSKFMCTPFLSARDWIFKKRVTSMLVTDVWDQMCWWQVWDVDDWFRILITDSIHWENHQHNEKSRQHNDSATSISNQSPS